MNWKIIFCFFSFLPIQVNCQNAYSTKSNIYININGGPSKFLGDIGGYTKSISRNLKLDRNTFIFGTSIQRIYKQKFAWEIGINTGKLAASDADINYKTTNDAEYLRFRRNLNFKTSIFEGTITTTFYPLKFLNKKWTVSKWKIQPLIYAGIGFFTFNPKGSYYDPIYKTDIWIDLKPLHTEGQGYAEYPNVKNYSLTQIHIPYGYGFTYMIADNFLISASLNSRKLFTDYLDDVSGTYIDTKIHQKYFTDTEVLDQAILMSDKSQLVDPFYKPNNGEIRGNLNKQDSFFSYNLKLSFRIGSKWSKKPNYYKYDDKEICD